MIKYCFIVFGVCFLLNSCSKEKVHPNYETFQEQQVEKTNAKQIEVPVFLAEKVLPAKYDKYKKLLKHVKSTEVFISEEKNESFDSELTTALKKDDFEPLMTIKSKGEYISIHHKKSPNNEELHDFVVYVNDPSEKLGINFTTDVNPEELAEVLKNVGIQDISKLKKVKILLKSMMDK